jgi:hypothetical protein
MPWRFLERDGAGIARVDFGVWIGDFGLPDRVQARLILEFGLAILDCQTEILPGFPQFRLWRCPGDLAGWGRCKGLALEGIGGQGDFLLKVVAIAIVPG